MGLHEIKRLLHSKGHFQQSEQTGSPQRREKIFASYTSDKRLVSRIHKELQKSKCPKTLLAHQSMGQWSINGAILCTDGSQKKNYKWQKVFKECSTWGLRCSALKNTACSNKGSGFNSQIPHVHSKLSVTLVPENLMASSGLCDHKANMWCT